MLKHWLGEHSEFDATTALKAMGIGSDEQRATMRQAILANPYIPNQYASEIVDLGLQAGMQAMAAALSAIDNTASLGTHPAVCESTTQIGLQVAAQAISTLSKSMLEVMMAQVGAPDAVNLMAKSR